MHQLSRSLDCYVTATARLFAKRFGADVYNAELIHFPVIMLSTKQIASDRTLFKYIQADEKLAL